jgi:hypothetical protein
MTGAVWLSLCLVYCKLQPHAINMVSYIVAWELWPCCWRVSILYHHLDALKNSGPHDSVQWCHRLLTQGYSSQRKMLIMYIHIVLWSRLLGALPSCLLCLQIDTNKIVTHARHQSKIYGQLSFSVGARGSIVGWGIMLQAGRSRVQVPIKCFFF